MILLGPTICNYQAEIINKMLLFMSLPLQLTQYGIICFDVQIGRLIWVKEILTLVFSQ